VECVEQVLLHKKRGQEKRGVGLQLHVFLVAEFVELDVFGTVKLERSWKNGSRAVQTPPRAAVAVGWQYLPYPVSVRACVWPHAYPFPDPQRRNGRGDVAT
jgi:hypothetical protein